MQVDHLHAHHPMRTGTNTLKRSRSTSPSSNKRRAVPTNYTPSIYAQLPPHLTRALSTTSSGASSPHDWVSRTGDLHIATPTPPALSPEPDEGYGYHSSTAGMHSQESDAMEADEEPLPRNESVVPDTLSLYHLQQQQQQHHQHHHSLPSTPALRNSPFASHHSTPPPAPPSSPTQLPPHHAPSLFANLAGSPPSLALSRTSSATTDASMSDEPLDPRQVLLPTSPQRRQRSHPGHSYSMGYRSDCEKCVARVPGHYSHIG